MSEKHSTQIRWRDDTWRALPMHPGYFVTEDGRILSIRRRKPRLLKPQLGLYGHWYVFVRVDGKQHKLFVHKAVLLAYVGPCPPGMPCRHLDGNGANNQRLNLVWGTPLENSDDKRRHGTMPIGEKAASDRLTEQIVAQLPTLLQSHTTRELGRRFGVSHTAIRRAALGINWAHLHGEHI